MITWREVATFGDLQRWLDEHDMAIGDISRVYVAQKTPSPWKATVEPNNPSNPIVAMLGATEEDFLERPCLCEVTEDGEDVEDALLAVLRKVDEMLGNVPAGDLSPSDVEFFGGMFDRVGMIRERVRQGTADVNLMVNAIQNAVVKGLAGPGITAVAMFYQRRFVELVLRLLPEATEEYRAAVVEELYKR